MEEGMGGVAMKGRKKKGGRPPRLPKPLPGPTGARLAKREAARASFALLASGVFFTRCGGPELPDRSGVSLALLRRASGAPLFSDLLGPHFHPPTPTQLGKRASR